MEYLGTFIQLSREEILNGFKSVTYPGGLKYSGEWEKGRKIGEGFLEYVKYKIKVKIKQGLIHKFIEIIEYRSDDNTISLLKLPDIKVIQVEDSFIEEVSDTYEFFYIVRGRKILFDGKSCNYIHEKIIEHKNLILYFGKTFDQKYKSINVMDLEIENIKFIGQNTNSSPNGLTKIFTNGLKFKGIMKGLFFKGLFYIKNEFFKAYFEADFERIKDTIKVLSKVLNFQVTMIYSKNKTLAFKENTGLNLDFGKSFQQEIIEFLNICTLNFFKSFQILRKYNLSTLLISYSLIVNENWLLFERRLIKIKEFERNSSDLDEKTLKLLNYNERYEGKIVNGKFEGFGKYFYSDGSVYVGEFHNNLRHGLGTFKFRNRRLFKGYWVNNIMQGKGLVIANRERFYGLWERNKISKECVYATNKIN